MEAAIQKDGTVEISKEDRARLEEHCQQLADNPLLMKLAIKEMRKKQKGPSIHTQFKKWLGSQGWRNISQGYRRTIYKASFRMFGSAISINRGAEKEDVVKALEQLGVDLLKLSRIWQKYGDGLHHIDIKLLKKYMLLDETEEDEKLFNRMSYAIVDNKLKEQGAK